MGDLTTVQRPATIRPATEEDLDAVVALGLAFHAGSPYRDLFDADPARLRLSAAEMVEKGVIFVAEQDGALVGMLGGVMAHHFVSGEPFAAELCWWVLPEARGRSGLRLETAFLAWAREHGATFVTMSAPTDRAARLFERLGYALMERAYYRRL